MKKESLTKGVLSILAVLFLLPLMVNAQWSPDSLLNLAIADTAGSQATPKMTETSDGGCYICWFDNRNGNYCMYLQRLNSLGEAQFESNGMLISDHAQSSSLVDYDMTVDHNDNAVIVFTDTRNGSPNDLDVFAYKIAPDGSFLWGPNGVGLSDSINSDFEPAPKVTATSEGNFVVGWMKSGAADVICFQKISVNGQKLWGTSGITISGIGDERLSAPDLVAAENDSVIAMWKNSTGPWYAPITHLYTQKFAPDGGFAWGASGVLIYNLGNMTAWTYPEIYPDAHGGAFYTWYDSPSNAFNVWVQHVDAAGSLVFPINGIQASTNSSDRLHMNPSLSYLPDSDELFVFWVEENWNQSQYGLYGQKFSPMGERLWTDSGAEFIRMGDDQIHFVRSMPTDTSIYVSYFQCPTVISTAVKAFCIDPDGNMYWDPRLLSSADLGSKDDLLMVVNTEDRAFLCWTDARYGQYDIFAQNVNPDGTLGNPSTSVSEPVPLTPDRFILHPPYPNPFNPATTINYQLPAAGHVNLSVYDINGRIVAELVNGWRQNGTHDVIFDASELASGVYFYRMSVGASDAVQKMVLLK